MCRECDSDHYIPPEIEDPVLNRLLAPWDGQAGMAREYDGWHIFSPDALEAETIVFLDRLTRRLVNARSDLIIIETGVGQGYTTRQLVHHLRPDHDLYWCYESDDHWREALQGKMFWQYNLSACIKDYPMPEPREMAVADLVIIHSSRPWSYSEFHLWEATRKEDSILVFTGDLDTNDPVLLLNNPKGTRVMGSAEMLQVAERVWTSLFERRQK